MRVLVCLLACMGEKERADNRRERDVDSWNKVEKRVEIFARNIRQKK